MEVLRSSKPSISLDLKCKRWYKGLNRPKSLSAENQLNLMTIDCETFNKIIFEYDKRVKELSKEVQEKFAEEDYETLGDEYFLANYEAFRLKAIQDDIDEIKLIIK